ncbi:hypothetical protein LVJ94_46385 [Pendulispora rubella]|uniref:DUF4139 domain-containing protein n=1 Tax=Pendulispora rubella TaxID=2741070 RepID=A0ABZ2L542_9BACT
MALRAPARRAPAPRARALSMATQTLELVIEPQIRRFPVHRYRGAALGVLILGIAAFFAVREIAQMEPLLAAQGSNAVRAVLYELPNGGELRVPIEPGTDVVRFVAHAYRRGDLSLSPRVVHLVVSGRGEHAARTEELHLEAPGLCSRVTPEESALQVGDPMPFEIDVHDLGVGELSVKLVTVDGADGLLARAYRREQLSNAEAAIRDAALARSRKDELARSAWELGWDDLTALEREAILRTRWHKLGALRGATHELRSASVVMSPPPRREIVARRDELLGRVPLHGDERIALRLHPGARLRVASEESTTLHVLTRDALGVEQETTAQADAEIGPFGDLRSVEVQANRDGSVEVGASSAAQVDWFGWTDAYRATVRLPVEVESSDAARVLRVTVRRPMDRSDASMAATDVRIAVKGPKTALSQTFRARRPRSRIDRYEGEGLSEAPSDGAVFYVVLLRGMTASIVPLEGALDVSLAELDESAPALPLGLRRTPEPASRPFVPRRPSNAAAFEPDAHEVVRTARWIPPVTAHPGVALGHAKHGRGERILRDAKTFEVLGDGGFELENDGRRPLVVPIVALSNTTTTLTIQAERGAEPPRPGLREAWTLPRTMEVPAGEATRAAFVIGEDIPPGRLRLRITRMDELDGHSDGHRARVLVHLPWAITNRRAAGPRWVSGSFEE